MCKFNSVKNNFKFSLLNACRDVYLLILPDEPLDYQGQRLQTLMNKALELIEKIKPFFMEDANPNKEVQESVDAKKEVIPDKENEAGQSSTGGPQLGTPQSPRLNMITAFVNGAGVGLLLGALVGLSISPVVSGVIGTKSGLLAVLLGLNEKYLSPVTSLRIGAFGFSCVAGILLGIYIRTNNAMMPDREKMLNDYMKVGFSKQVALDFIVYREFNMIPADWKNGTKPSASQSGNGAQVSADPKDAENQSGTDLNRKSNSSAAGGNGKENASNSTPSYVFASANETGAERKSVLYSSEVEASDCDLLNNADSSQDMAEIINTFDMAGGSWRELEKNMIQARLTGKIFVNSILTIRDCFCASDKRTGKIKVTYNTKLNDGEHTQTLDQIEALITPKDNILFTIKQQVSKRIPVNYRKQVYMAVIKTFCHE